MKKENILTCLNDKNLMHWVEAAIDTKESIIQDLNNFDPMRVKKVIANNDNLPKDYETYCKENVICFIDDGCNDLAYQINCARECVKDYVEEDEVDEVLSFLMRFSKVEKVK